MTATTLRQDEAAAEDYPEVDVSTEAEPFLPAAWARIEAYIARRFAARVVTWIAEGPGDWLPPLKPATITSVEEWRGSTWEETTLDPSPLGGFVLKGCGPYRFTADVGDDADVPPLIVEAVKRLAEYFAVIGFDGVGLRTENVDGVWSGEHDNRARARALQDSGAADLLRNYRRV